MAHDLKTPLTSIIGYLTLLLELNYTEENKEKLKIIIYALKKLFMSSKKKLIIKIKREDLIYIYDNCKNKKDEYEKTSKEIHNFFEYYYISLIRNLEKAI